MTGINSVKFVEKDKCSECKKRMREEIIKEINDELDCKGCNKLYKYTETIHQKTERSHGRIKRSDKKVIV